MCSCTAIRKRRKDDEGRAEIKRGVREKIGGKKQEVIESLIYKSHAHNVYKKK